MSVVSVSISCLGCRHTRISIESVIFTHHSIGLSSFRHFCIPCQHHSISLSSIPPFCVPFNRPIQHVVYVKKINLSDRLCRFYTPFNRFVIGSTIFAHHSMGLYRMSVVSVSISCLGCRHTKISIDSVIFTHHSICLSSVPPFLHMSAAYTACGCVPWSQIQSRYMSRTMDSPHLKYHHVTRPES